MCKLGMISRDISRSVEDRGSVSLFVHIIMSFIFADPYKNLFG